MMLKYFLFFYFTLCACNIQAQYNDLKLAEKYYALGNFSSAITAFEKAAKENPYNPILQMKLADSYRMQHQYEKAEYWYYLASKNEKSNPEIFFAYGNILKQNQKYDKAKEVFEIYKKYNWKVGEHFSESCDYSKSLLSEKSKYKITPASFNSNEADFGPAFFNNQLVYSTCNPTIQRSSAFSNDLTSNSFNQLYIASGYNYDNLKSKPLGDYTFKEKLNQGPVCYYNNGKKVVYTNNNFISGTKIIPANGTQLSIYFADVSPDGSWSGQLPFKYNSSEYSVGYPYITEDGKKLYFASNLDKSSGYDIYVSYYSPIGWSKPQNVGGAVNTAGDEISPFLSDDVLYFSSNYHPGLGGFDLFSASNDGNNQWFNITNLGKTLNSSYDETSFIYDIKSNTGFITSDRNDGKGFEDIYKIKYAAQKITIIVKDSNTKLRVPNASVIFETFGNNSFLTNNKGEYEFTCPLDVKISAIIKKANYVDEKFTFQTSSDKIYDKTIEVTIDKSSNNFDIYEGIVISGKDGRPVTKANITITQQNTGEKQIHQTDDSGKFSAKLAKNTTYQLSADKWSYSITNLKITTLPYFSPHIINTIRLNPEIKKDSDVPELALAQKSTETPPLKPVTITNPVNTVTSKYPKKNYISPTAYYIQIGAFNNPNTALMDKIEKSELIFYISKNNTNVYKIGPFNTLWSATQSLRNVQNIGFKDAFLIHPSSGEGIQTNAATTIKTTYRVQIGAYTNSKWFDRKKASNIGSVLEEVDKDGLIIYYLGNYSTVDEAKKAMNTAKMNGFTNAFVVSFKNGKKERVQ